MAELIEFDAARCKKYLQECINQFLNDPPDTDFQRGYLAAAITIYKEALNRPNEDALIVAANKLF